jgi:hypothetical protein
MAGMICRLLYLYYEHTLSHYPEEVTGFFPNERNLTSRIIAVGLIQPLAKMNARNLVASKARLACSAGNLTATCQPIYWKVWVPSLLTILYASMACYRDTFTFYSYILLRI